MMISFADEWIIKKERGLFARVIRYLKGGSWDSPRLKELIEAEIEMRRIMRKWWNIPQQGSVFVVKRDVEQLMEKLGEALKRLP